MTLPLWALRGAVVAGSLSLWFLTQRLLARRGPPREAGGPLEDVLHDATARWNAALHARPAAADRLLLGSSLVIDLLGIWILASAIFGPGFRPFLGLLLLFALRQVCQALCPLPPPRGMIWRDPGFPTLLVTYRTTDDLFFSGHTALAVYGAALLGTAFGPAGAAAGAGLVLFEVAVVIVLRAHYTMDVFAGIVTALLVHLAAGAWAPAVDRWLAALQAGL